MIAPLPEPSEYSSVPYQQKYTNYEYSFLKRHVTTQLAEQYLHVMNQKDKLEYRKQLGQFVYEFEIKYVGNIYHKKSERTPGDEVDAWRVLKTKRQIQKYLSAQGNTYLINQKTKSLINIQDFQGTPFRIVQSPKTSASVFLPSVVIKFFQLYNLNIKKRTSFLMQKKTRGLTRIKRLHNWCVGARWNLKRIIITKQGVIQMGEKDGLVTDFLKFDALFSMKSGSKATHEEFGIALVSAQRKMVLKARNPMQFLSFLYYITKQINQKKKGLQFLSSSLRQSDNNIDFYVDAKDYYTYVADGIQKAQVDIFMCGWWISPQLYLKRPINQYESENYWRLDKVIQRAANRGVKIYIVVFYAPFIIPNDSDHTKRALAALHSNIIVERHPHEILPKMWSHHQKAVIIDQKVAFMGGLDLCYGRYDTNDHPINSNDKLMYPGIDYNNVRIKDFVEVCKPQAELQSRNQPRMPWHDVAYRVEGRVVSDVANHFVEYWNFTLLQKKMIPIKKKQAKQSNKRENLQSNQKTKQLGFQAFTKVVANHHSKGQKLENQNANNPEDQSALQLHNGAGENSLLLSMDGLGLLRGSKPRNENFIDQIQLLRSASQWSIGLQEGVTQRSIQNAYIDNIYKAKSFIYIENQFFISATGDPDSYVTNQIANALYQRIERAHKKGENFRVVVFMPLLPGMEGSLDDDCPLSLKLTMHWQYNTISRGESSLLKRVARLNNGDYKKYIEFFSLRNHGLLDGQPVTELIYIHTKLMIVDDDIIICGSANVNDRSQAGDRDSQLAIILTDGEKVDSMMNGKQVRVNKKAHQLRVKLFMEHFGLCKSIARDPVENNNVKQMTRIAQINTQIYRQIFGCCPDDKVKRLSDVKNFEVVLNIDTYERLYRKIQGYVVEFPTQFLAQETLKTIGFDTIQDIFI